MDICKRLKNVQLKGFAPVRWDVVFLRLEYELRYGTVQKGILKRFLKILLKGIIYKKNCFLSIKTDNNILYVQDNDRISCQNLFNEIAQLIGADTIQYRINKYFKIYSFKDVFRLYFIYMPSWLKSLASLGFTINTRLILVSQLIILWYLHNKVKKIHIEHYKILLTFYDSFLTESYLVELFKYYKIPTASLQHGIFVGKRAETLIHSGVELATFKSDYLFCWNKFTIDEAVKAGIPSQKLILTGILGFFGKKPARCIRPNNKIFGVVLTHPEYEEENIKLIESANNLARSIGHHFYLKLHPNYNDSHFNSYVDKQYFLGTIKKGIPMLEYTNMVEFSVVGSSSVFVELVFLRHEVLRLSSKSVTDKYRDISIGKIFHNPDEIVDVYHREKSNSYNDELFDYLCSVEDVTTEYLKAIDKCVENGCI